MDIKTLEANPLRQVIGPHAADAMAAAYRQACWSKDPNTRVGAVLVRDGRTFASGLNSFPRRVLETSERMTDRSEKNAHMIHAEVNAVLDAAFVGFSTVGAICYLIATDDSGELWGGPPCFECCKVLIQAGIVEVRSLPFKATPSKWLESTRRGRLLLHEVGIPFVELIPAPGLDVKEALRIR